jgi:hypothetical protein
MVLRFSVNPVMNNLFSKVKHRLGDILGKVIPYNQYLRPIDFRTSSKTYFDTYGLAVQNYKKIFDGYKFRLQLPLDLFEEAERFEKLQPEVDLPDVVVVKVPNGRLYTDAYNTVAVVTPDNILLQDVSLELREKNKVAPFVNHIFKIKYFSKPRIFNGGVFTLLTGGGGLDNYFHWLFDVLPRIHLLNASGLLDHVSWYLVPCYRFKYQIDTLALLGIRKDRIIDGSKVMHLQAHKLLASSPHRNGGQMERWACNFLRESFIPWADDNSESPSLIYISRNDSRSRNVSKEGELITLLSSYGFKTVFLTGLTFLEQVRLFNRAKAIISPHGAGLANLVFCEPGTKIFEIFSEGWIGTMYYDLAQKMELDYYYYIAKVSLPPKTAAEAKHKHFAVDISMVDSVLKTFQMT